MEALLYFDETQNVNVNLLISAHRLTSTTQNDKVQDLHHVVCFVKVKQQTHSVTLETKLSQKTVKC